MKINYLLGLFVVIGIVQQSLATTFKIVEFVGGTEQTTGGIKAVKKGIDEIAPLYKDNIEKSKPPAYQVPKEMKYTVNHAKDGRGFTLTNVAYGISGTTPAGITHLKGIAFKIKGKTYRAIFKPNQEPSRLGISVLIEIYVSIFNESKYKGVLYQDSRAYVPAMGLDIIEFEAVP